MGSARIWLFGSATQVHNQSSIMDHLRTGSGTDEASASPARPSFTPILGRVNLLGQARRRPPRRVQNWLCTVVLGQRRRLCGCLPGYRDRWFRPVIGRRSVKYRVGGDGSRRRNQKILWPAQSDIRGKLPHRPNAHSRRRPPFDGPHPLPAVKRDIASAEAPGRNHPFVQTARSTVTRHRSFEPQYCRPAERWSPYRIAGGLYLRAGGWAWGGHRPRCRSGSRRQTSNRSGPGGPLGASHLGQRVCGQRLCGQRLCGQRLCGQRRTPLPEIRVPDVGTPVTAVRAMPAHGRGIPVSSVGLRPADGLRFPARPGDCPGLIEEANATNGVGQIPRVIKCRPERSARIVW